MEIDQTPIIGIDLGTTNSLVAAYLDGKVQVIEEDGEALLPSVVALTPDNKLIIGQSAKNQLAAFPDRTIASIKRRMGEAIQVPLGDRSFSPQEISAMILRRLKHRAEKALGVEVNRAVITVPAFFDESQRQATREAGVLAGLDVERIINEPTAASLVYHAASPERRHLIVYDLGGGTFDVSIVRMESGVVEVLSSKGDTRLGGDDFDERLTKYVADRVLSTHSVDLMSSSSLRWRLNQACEKAKCALSYESEVRITEEYMTTVEGQPFHLDITVTRSEYEELIVPFVERTLECVSSAIRDSQLTLSQIDELILVGGSTRTPLIQSALRNKFSREPRWSVNPDLAVALGAAMQAAMQSGKSVGPVLIDVATHTVGITALDGSSMMSELKYCPILRRNTPLPARYEEVFSTTSPGQEKVMIEVLQGESPRVEQNRMIGSFLLDGLKRSRDELREILVRFELTLDGVLEVTAHEKGTKNSESLKIENAMATQRGNDKASQARSVVSLDEYDFSDEIGDVSGSILEGGFIESQDSFDPQETEGDPSQGTSGVATIHSKLASLIEQAERIKGELESESAQEMQRILSGIQQAQQEQDLELLSKLEFELDDLLFYLAD